VRADDAGIRACPCAIAPLVLSVADCRAAYERIRALGVEFTPEPASRYSNVDAGFRDRRGTAGR